MKTKMYKRIRSSKINIGFNCNSIFMMSLSRYVEIGAQCSRTPFVPENVSEFEIFILIAFYFYFIL